MCAVTAISRPDGTAASAIQTALSCQLGADVVAIVSDAVTSGIRLGERSIKKPHAATSAIST